ICLVVGLVALTVPASGWAQSSSQAQYQGVAPETQLPVTGSGSGGAGGTVVTGGGGTQATGGSTAGGSSGTSGASGNGGAGASNTGGAKGHAPLATPSASSSTSPFSGGDILLIVLAAAGLVVLGFV